jgi:hypothetical protein
MRLRLPFKPIYREQPAGASKGTPASGFAPAQGTEVM